MCSWLSKWWVFIVGFVTVCFIWLFFGGYDSAANGPDKFDSLNSLFAGLAFVGMFSALRMQSEEISLQREELRATREELELTRKAAQEQSDIQMMGLLLNTANVQLTETMRRIDNIRSFAEARRTIIVAEGDLEKAIDEAGRDRSFLINRISALELSLFPFYSKYIGDAASPKGVPSPAKKAPGEPTP